ncbi:GNAT family N-acetyltransferase [Bacillus pseudomycoides]|uniref:GNAT family N-acetyltransferase n=1 Tax=Bacillus pseudomycoides TaxID=64104 RepID=A0AA91VBX6_9BACI|nr:MULTISPECIES: GNAT family N-acetyltransferase [Bacillus]PEB51900.1 GNAT family N-acetyltransferase [Bacillus sp. AFS098217]PED81813.1 GNAT family N-acetyltransferase [Bacillus pseudomycoides]PEU15241.1 GNAT family N-acetyltransferase [Bacillus sp. AFS014408]PEU17844.1 GNAT family N-acetyltransferase [Bacillus sp. AFS019443]PFW63359.1 GNAT family N-acetyltransferase [Bacillus sp. AFS075034]
MICKLSATSLEVASAILAIQIPAYQVEAKYINSTAIPRLYDTVQDIQTCNETFYGYFFENKLIGFISFVNEESFINIHRLVISPAYFHRGIATKLILHLFHIFPNTTKYIVQTGKANTPALSLYKKHGFIEVEDIVLPDGLILTQLEKTEKNK